MSSNTSVIGTAIGTALSAGAAFNPIIAIAAAAEPAVVGIINAIRALTKKYPSLTPEQIAAMVLTIATQNDALFDDALATIAADKAAHPGT